MPSQFPTWRYDETESAHNATNMTLFASSTQRRSCNGRELASSGGTLFDVCLLQGPSIVSLLCQMTYDSQALHGDITQANRESTLAGFKKGSFKVSLLLASIEITVICPFRPEVGPFSLPCLLCHIRVRHFQR